MVKTLAIGMTVGFRKNQAVIYDYCTQSIASLRQVGFTQPLHVFVEPRAKIHLPRAKQWGLTVRHNEANLGCFSNFKQGAQLLVDQTDADWIMMLQDDSIWTSGGMEALMAAINDPEYQKVGFLSPYTGKAMVGEGQKKAFKQRQGRDVQWASCRFHNKAFWGAVAMVFPRASLIKMQTEGERYRKHTHVRKLDVVVGNTIRRDLEMDILVAVPSIVDHIGSWSTMGRHRLKSNQWGRRGYGFKTKG